MLCTLSQMSCWTASLCNDRLYAQKPATVTKRTPVSGPEIGSFSGPVYIDTHGGCQSAWARFPRHVLTLESVHPRRNPVTWCDGRHTSR